MKVIWLSKSAYYKLYNVTIALYELVRRYHKVGTAC